jgi:hypothetical protein
VIVQKGVVIDGKVLEGDERLVRPREDAERLISLGHARPIPRHRYVALENVIIGGNCCYDRGQVFVREEPVPNDTVEGVELPAAGKVLPLADDEPVPDPLPDPPLDGRMWQEGPPIECIVTEAGSRVFLAASAGDSRILRERAVCDYWFFGQVKITGHLTAIGRAYRDEARRTGERPDYVSLARQRRRQPVPPADPEGAGEILSVRVLRPCTIAGRQRMPDERVTTFAWQLAEPWVRGQIDLGSRPTPRFRDHADRIKGFLESPDAKYPVY